MNEFPIIVILFIWSAVLLYSSLQLRHVARDLEEEREALRRWKRLKRVADEQRSKWQ